MLYRYLLLFLLPFLVSSLTAYFDPHILHLGDSIHSKKSLLLPLQKAFFLLLTFYLVNSFSTFKIQFECHFLSPQSLSKDHLPPSALEVSCSCPCVPIILCIYFNESTCYIRLNEVEPFIITYVRTFQTYKIATLHDLL